MRKKSGNLLGAVIPAMLLCAPAFASSARSLSRLRGKNLAVKSASVVAGSTQAEGGTVSDPFAVFGDNFGASALAPLAVDSDVMAFLKDNDLLRATGEAVSQVSGEVDSVLGRKDFADARLRSHCHVSGWASYSYTQASCVNRGGTWDPVPAYPMFENTSVLNKTATSFNVGVDLNKSGTVYAVLVLATDPAPSSAQVKAGQNSSGAAALQAKNLAATSGAFTGTFSFTGLTAGTAYRVYLVGDNGALTATPAVVNPAFEHGTVFSTTNYYVFPKVTTSPNGNLYTLYWDGAAHSYNIDKWNEGTGVWAGYTSFTSANTGTYQLSWGGYDQAAFRASSPDASTDNIHMAFEAGVTNMANTYDPYYGLYNGSWSFTKIYDDIDAPDGFNIFVDNSSKAHVTYNVSAASGYYMRYDTNASAAFPHASTAIQTNAIDRELGESFIVRESGGTVHLFYGSEQDPWTMGYYMANSADSYATKTLILDSLGDGKIYDVGNVVIDSSNKIHLVYTDTTNGRAYYRTNKSGSWVTTELTTSGRTNLKAYDIKIHGTTHYVVMGSSAGYYLKAYDGTTWRDGNLFDLDGYMRQFTISPTTGRVMVVGEVSGNPYKVTYTTGMVTDFVAAPNTAPVFVGSTTTLTVNQNASATDIKGILHVNDSDSGQTETWTQSVAPSHGTLSFSGATASSGSSDITPGGTITYTPAVGYSGSDSFTVQVSDGAGGSATRTISVTVTPSHAVIYNGNGSTGGTVPVDGTGYFSGDTATVLGNSGNLVRTGHSFNNWNTVAGGSGTSYIPGNTFTMGTADVTLYAQWNINSYSVTPSAGSGGSISPTAPQSIPYGSTTTFTITPAPGYKVVTPVGGTCGGTYSGSPYDSASGISYTTSAIAANCTVAATFSAIACTPKPGGLMAWWRSEANGSDIVGAHDLTLNNASYDVGKFGQALSFSGSNSYVTVGGTSSDFDFSNKPFSIAAWIRIAADATGGAAGYMSIFDRSHTGYADGYRLDYSVTSQNFRLLGISGLSIPATLSPGTWYHVAAVSQNGAGSAIYLNGVQIGATGTHTTNNWDVTPRIGDCQNTGDAPFKGEIDEVQVYNRALGLAEVQDLYNDGSKGICTDPAVLNLSIVGNGSVTSSNGIGTNDTCNSGTCTPVNFSLGDTVTLSPTGSNSTFDAWSGDISGSANPYTGLQMNGNKAVTATFNANPALVQISGSGTVYYTLISALADCGGDAVIMARDTVFSGDLTVTGHTITLRGGFPDASFSGDRNNYTTINGPLAITGGKLIADRVKIRTP